MKISHLLAVAVVASLFCVSAEATREPRKLYPPTEQSGTPVAEVNKTHEEKRAEQQEAAKSEATNAERHWLNFPGRAWDWLTSK